MTTETSMMELASTPEEVVVKNGQSLWRGMNLIAVATSKKHAQEIMALEACAEALRELQPMYSDERTRAAAQALARLDALRP